MRRLLPTLLVATLAASSVQANLLDSWHEVQGQLAAGDVAGAQQAITLLQEEAIELEIERMTNFAAALVTWAEEHPGPEGEAILEAANQLDPEYPPGHFLEARWGWANGSKIKSVQQYVTGWLALIMFEPTRKVVGAWLLMWTIAALVATLVAMIVVVTVRHLRGMVFDARDLGGRIFQPANAWVFAFVMLLLPLFAALGPLWLAVYLFVLSWAYLSQGLRIWAFLACLVLAFVVPSFAMIQHEMLRGERLVDRVGLVLDERQADFSTLREFSELEPEFEDVADYHLIFGEILRMHGEPALARVQFQKATLLDSEEARPLVFVANLALEEGNAKRAIQLFTQALEFDGRNAFAYHNLSLAFDLSRRFQEGDAARARAREIAGRGVSEEGLRGLDPRIRYPRLGTADVAAMVELLSQDQQAILGRVSTSLSPFKQLASPLSLVFLVGAIVGLALLLFRLRFFPPGRECSKCGKLYRMEAGYGESTVYCSQCVSVFMKRDVVSIEQQTAKMDQIRRWEGWSSLLRRVSGFLIPGSQDVLGGSVIRGFFSGFLAWFFLTGALVWVPTFVPRIEPLAAFRQLQVLLIVLFGLLALRSGISAWGRR